MRTGWLGITAASLALGGCSTTHGILGSADPSPDAGAYVASAAAADLFETQASQLALSQAQRPDVRALARELSEAHSQTTQRLAAAALASGASTPVPALTGRQQQMLSELQAAGPDSFDATYLRQQLSSHQQAVRIHDAYALSDDAEPLRFVAASAAAAVYGHLEEVRRIRRVAGLD